jgi:hypothetical protein
MRTVSIIALMIETVLTSETSVFSKETTWRYIPKGFFNCYMRKMGEQTWRINFKRKIKQIENRGTNQKEKNNKVVG